MNREAIEFFEALKQDEYAFTERDKEMFDVAISALSYDDTRYHEEHGEVVITDDIWEDANKAFLYEQKHRSMVEDIRAEITQIEDGISSYHNDRPWVYKDEVLDIIDRHMGKETGE